MEKVTFEERDRFQMESLGTSEDQVRDQIKIFEKSSYFMHLARNSTLGDGIRKISSAEEDRYLQKHRQAAEKGRFLKFVPASGAATRMFKALFKILRHSPPLKRETIHRKAKEGDETSQVFLRFINEISSFAFFRDLKETVARDGLILENLLHRDQFQKVLEYFLTEKGLQYGSLPKGLLKFHEYPSGSRTAFEEHFVEAAHYVRDENGVCRLHFTVSPEHEEGFRRCLERVKAGYEQKYGVRYEVSFSTQKLSTNTIAVDLDNRPFRDEEGNLLFRPGGHGALLENLNEFQGDLIYIKNIDNVVPDRLKESTFHWKKILGGCLAEMQEQIHSYLKTLKEGGSGEFLEEIAAYCREKICVTLPKGYERWSSEEKRHFLIQKLNRPIRVCGVVENQGEPGGAPFWVSGKNGVPSLQIVERAQVDFDSADQKKLWESSTHFNPVDLVCAVRNDEGKPFDLKRYVDPDAVFISEKTQEGKSLKALELPGLWNGAMSDWISLFVEVPLTTFNPVKTINDLLRPEHRTGS